MMSESVLIHKLDVPAHVGVEPLFAALRWPTDRQAKLAWEKAQAKAKVVSCWRVRFPMAPPHTDYCCIVMGEDVERVAKAIRILTRVKGWESYDIPAEMARSLALRRYRLAVSGKTSEVVRGTPRTMRRDGTMEPYEGEV